MSNPATSAGDTLSHRKDVESFEAVWSTIQEKHWDLKNTPCDWNEVHTRYLPLIQKCKTRKAWREVIRNMIGELGQTHFGLLASEHFESLKELENKLPRGYGITDFVVEAVQGHIMVVGPSDLNEKPTLPRGTEILNIRGVPAASVLSALEEAYKNSHQKELYTTRLLRSFFSGTPGETLPLSVKMPLAEKPETIRVPVIPSNGISQQLGDLPPMRFHFDQKKLDDNVGLIAFNIFLFPLTKQFPSALNNFKDCNGLIIDLRGNGGGIGFLASNLAGYLSNKKGKLGTMISKDSEINFPVLPRPDTWKKPLAIIIDGGSASTSEIFAAGIQDLGIGRIFGTQSAGAALPSFIETLPNGDMFQYAFASYKSVKGRYLEGNGVQPDVASPHTYDMLLHGKDASIEAARTWIHSHGENK